MGEVGGVWGLGFWEGSPHRLSDKHYKFNSYYYSFKEVRQENGKDCDAC